MAAVAEASSPFDRASNTSSDDDPRLPADLVIRTRDGVSFHVHKIILGVASPAFAAMFINFQNSPAHAQDSAEEPLALEEDARTLDALFRICYPVEDPVLDQAQDIFNVLSAARKYMMDHATAFCRRALRGPKFLAGSPFDVFTIAAHFGFEEEARVAALETLQCKSPPNELPVAIESISSAVIWQLFTQYRDDCRTAVWDLITNRLFWNGILLDHALAFFCPVCDAHVPVAAYPFPDREFPLDLDAYCDRICKLLDRLPCGVPGKTTGEELWGLTILETDMSHFKCASCREQAVDALKHFQNTKLLPRLERAVSQVT